MKFIIMQADGSRARAVSEMRTILMRSPHWREEFIEAVDGRIDEQLHIAARRFPYEVHYGNSGFPPTRGQLGVWYSVLTAIEHAPLVVFEDDVILNNEFVEMFVDRASQIPATADFFTMHNPPGYDRLYKPEKHDFGGERVCRVYQPHGGLAVCYTRRGAERFKRLVDRDGIMYQWDNQLMNYAWHGELEGYTSKPGTYPMVSHAPGPSLAQTLEFA
jgi:hypothetical protein